MKEEEEDILSMTFRKKVKTRRSKSEKNRTQELTLFIPSNVILIERRYAKSNLLYAAKKYMNEKNKIS